MRNTIGRLTIRLNRMTIRLKPTRRPSLDHRRVRPVGVAGVVPTSRRSRVRLFRDGGGPRSLSNTKGFSARRTIRRKRCAHSHPPVFEDSTSRRQDRHVRRRNHREAHASFVTRLSRAGRRSVVRSTPVRPIAPTRSPLSSRNSPSARVDTDIPKPRLTFGLDARRRMLRAARAMLGGRTRLLKGRSSGGRSSRRLDDEGRVSVFRAARIRTTSTARTCCTLAAATRRSCARMNLAAAVRAAKRFVTSPSGCPHMGMGTARQSQRRRPRFPPANRMWRDKL